MTGVQAIAAGGAHTCALTTAGGVRCWGQNGNGQLGVGAMSNYVASPSTTDVLTGVQAIATGEGQTCAVLAAGGVRCWGLNVYGEAGVNTNDIRIPAPPTTDVLPSAKNVGCGATHSCAVTTTGDIRCWGLNDLQQVERSLTAWLKVPSTTPMMTNAQSVAANRVDTCGLSVSGGVRCWGAQFPGYKYHRSPEPVVMCP